MEAIMIAGVIVVAVGGWYSAIDMLTDMGILIRKQIVVGDVRAQPRNSCVSSQRGIKQMAGMNI